MEYKILETYTKSMDPAKQIFGIKGRTIDGPTVLHFTHLAAEQLIAELQHFLKERANEGLDS